MAGQNACYRNYQESGMKASGTDNGYIWKEQVYIPSEPRYWVKYVTTLKSCEAVGEAGGKAVEGGTS